MTELSLNDLIDAQRDVLAAHEAAKHETYGGDAWKNWLQAAENFHTSVTTYAKAKNVDRVTVEMDVKKTVRHPEPLDADDEA